MSFGYDCKLNLRRSLIDFTMNTKLNNLPWSRSFSFGRRVVDINSPCFIVAEIGGNFNGDYDLAIRSIDAAVACGVDAVKFQTYRAEDLVSDPGLMYSYTDTDGRDITVSQLEMFEKMQLPYEWHKPLRDYALGAGVQFLSSAADVQSVDLLLDLGVPVMKIASEDLINIPVVERVAASGCPALVSTGMASLDEIELALSIFQQHENYNVMLLQCTSRYPTPPEACNLKRIQTLAAKFGLMVGFSDHTAGSLAAALSVSLGARFVEKHFTLDRNLPGPDHAMSCPPGEFKQYVAQIRLAEALMGSARSDYDPSEEVGRTEYRRSIVANQRIPIGTVLTESMLAYRRPGLGLKPMERSKILNKKAVRDIEQNERILFDYVR